jgi:hypothetical protein
MRFPRRTSVLSIFFAVAAVLQATTVIPMSVERLTQASSKVLMGEAQDSWTEWSSDQKLIYTVTRFQVQKAYKGEAVDTVLVRTMGGRIGNIEQKVAGVRTWHPGEKAVLFLHESVVRDGSLAVTGLMQGDFRFTRQTSATEQFVSNGVPEVETFDASTKKSGVYSGSKITLRELERRVINAATAVTQ